MTVLQSILAFIAEHQLLASLGMFVLSVLDVFLTRLFSASVKYMARVRPADKSDAAQGTVVLKNLEASKIPRELRLEIMPTHADARIEPGTVRAATGPWLKQITTHGNGVAIDLNGLPAEGAIAFTFALSRNSEGLTVRWSDTTRGVRPLTRLRPKFNGALYFWKRGLLGIGWFTVLFAVLISARGITYVDGAIYFGGLALVVLAWLVALPMSGKDTACGYLMQRRAVVTDELPTRPSTRLNAVGDSGSLEATHDSVTPGRSVAVDTADKRNLKEALLNAFPSWSDLRQMVRYQLDENLAVITSESKSLDVNAFELVEWAASKGMYPALLIGARNQNPRNQALAHLTNLVGVSSSSVALEKIVSTNTVQLDPEVWREGLVTAEWRVCRIDIGGEGRGTGFLVGPDLVLTNFHVVEGINTETARTCLARFDHKVAPDGAEIIAGSAIRLASDWLVDHARYSRFDLVPDPKGGNPSPDELDFALIRLAEPIGSRPIGANAQSQTRGWVTLSLGPTPRDARMVSVLQHPWARPMKLSMGMDEVLRQNANGTRIRHGIPTEPGSSGSPLFDKHWNVIGLHHSGDPKTIKPEYNEAIPIALIANRPNVRAALQRSG